MDHHEIAEWVKAYGSQPEIQADCERMAKCFGGTAEQYRLHVILHGCTALSSGMYAILSVISEHFLAFARPYRSSRVGDLPKGVLELTQALASLTQKHGEIREIVKWLEQQLDWPEEIGE